MQTKVEYMNQTAYQGLLDRADNVVNDPIAFLNAAADFISAFEAHKLERGIFGFKSYENKVEFRNGSPHSIHGDPYDSVQYKQIADKINITNEQMWADIIASNRDNREINLFLGALYFCKTGKNPHGGINEKALHLKSIKETEVNYKASCEDLIEAAKDVGKNPLAFLQAAATFTSSFETYKKAHRIDGARSYPQKRSVIGAGEVLIFNIYDNEQYWQLANKLSISKADEKIWADLAASNADNPAVSSLLKNLYISKTHKELEGGENTIFLNLNRGEPAEAIKDLENFLEGLQIAFTVHELFDDDFEEFYNKKGLGMQLKSILERTFSERNKPIIKGNSYLLAKCGKALLQLEKLTEYSPCINRTVAPIVELYAKEPALTLAIHKAKLMEVIRSRQGFFVFNSSKNEEILKNALNNLASEETTTIDRVKEVITTVCDNYQPRFPWFDAVVEFVFDKHKQYKTSLAAELNAIEPTIN